MSVLSKLKKNSTIKETEILKNSKFFTEKDMIPTSIPVINIALSGRLWWSNTWSYNVGRSIKTF